MGLKSFVEGLKRKSEVYRELEAHDGAQDKLNQKKLSANERALNKILEKKRQEAISSALEKEYKKQDNEYWHKDVITQKEIFKEKKTPLATENLFTNQKNIFTNQRRSF